MLGHVTTITHKNNLVLSNIDPGAGGTSTKKVKIGNLPNIFDDDCRIKVLSFHPSGHVEVRCPRGKKKYIFSDQKHCFDTVTP